MPDTVASIVQPSLAKGWAADRNFHRWILIFLFIGACLLLKNSYPVLKTFPVGLTLPVTDWINWFTELLVATVKPFFRAITWLMNHPMSWARDLLHWFPWPAFILLVGLVSYSAGGWRLALFSSCSLAYMLVIGFWEESMNSLALVTISVPLAVLVGFVFGVFGILFTKGRTHNHAMSGHSSDHTGICLFAADSCAVRIRGRWSV